MAIPTCNQLIEPLLRALGARAQVADAMAVRAEDFEERLPSGRQAVFDNRVGWVKDRLKRARLSANMRRELRRLTSAGLDHARDLDGRPIREPFGGQVSRMLGRVARRRPRSRRIRRHGRG
ncbi:MAG: winged helix-turn-helix domain-containing protein [Myxococcota bacterium]